MDFQTLEKKIENETQTTTSNRRKSKRKRGRFVEKPKDEKQTSERKTTPISKFARELESAIEVTDQLPGKFSKCIRGFIHQLGGNYQKAFEVYLSDFPK